MKDVILHKQKSRLSDQSYRERSKKNNLQIARVILFFIFIVCMLLFLYSAIEKQRFVLELVFNPNALVVGTTLPLLVSIIGSLVVSFLLNLLYREQNCHVKLVMMDNSTYMAELKRKAKPNSLVTLS